MGFKKLAKKTVKAVKKTVKVVTKPVESVGKEIGRGAESLGKDIGRGAESLGGELRKAAANEWVQAGLTLGTSTLGKAVGFDPIGDIMSYAQNRHDEREERRADAAEQADLQRRAEINERVAAQQASQGGKGGADIITSEEERRRRGRGGSGGGSVSQKLGIGV